MDECPYCGALIGDVLIRYFRGQMPGTFFDFECPKCHRVMDVEAVPVPEFVLTKQSAPQPPDADANKTDTLNDLYEQLNATDDIDDAIAIRAQIDAITDADANGGEG